MKKYVTLAVILPALVGFSLLSASANAQSARPVNTLYASLKVGANAYGGELDGTGTDPVTGVRNNYGWLLNDLGFGLGAEVGYVLSEQWSAGLGLHAGTYPNLDRTDITNPNTGDIGQLNSGTAVVQLTTLVRFSPVSFRSVSPYAQAGVVLAVGQGREILTDSGILGAGPQIGIGAEFSFHPQSAFFIEVTGSRLYPDGAIDNSNPGELSLPWADNADYDATLQYAAGIRYYLKKGGRRVFVETSCPSSLSAGELGMFTVSANADASSPVSFTWSFGDGQAATGMTNDHAFSSPGTYTVSLSAEGPLNEQMASCVVQVSDPVSPPSFVTCTLEPSPVNVDQTIEVNAEIDGPHGYAVEVSFGDSTSAHDLPAQHSYSRAGEYEVNVTAHNASGSDTCVLRVSVGDTFCEQLAELSPVYFNHNSILLDHESRQRLDTNLASTLLCPDVCIFVAGYAGPSESDHVILSTQRASAVAQYYNDESRVRSRGRGLYVDPAGAGRLDVVQLHPNVVESIPVACASIDLME